MKPKRQAHTGKVCKMHIFSLHTLELGYLVAYTVPQDKMVPQSI